MNEKKLQKSESVKEKILLTAESEFSEHGYFGARVDAIAEHSGINKRIIYQHFESKETLYSKVLTRVYERLAQRERAYMTEDLPPIDAIRNIIYVSFEFLKDDPSFVRMLMWENLNRANSLPSDVVLNLKKPSFDYIRNQVNKGQAAGIFRKDIDPDQIVLSLTNFCFSYFSNIYTMSALTDKKMTDDGEVDARASFVSDLMIKYLKVRE